MSEMKYTITIFLIIQAVHVILAQDHQTVPSGLYPLPDNVTEHTFFTGSTKHFSDVVLRLETLSEADGELPLRSELEQILILKDGRAKVSVGNDSQTIGSNSVLFLLPGAAGTIEAESSEVRYYRMMYKTFQPTPSEMTDRTNSFIIEYDELKFHESSKGGTRRYFNTTTDLLPYYEMHMTTLRPGLQSHAPHTHEAAEIILMVEGETEFEISGIPYRGRKGDVYFTVSDAPHAIRNVGDIPCRYFAFQWGEK